MTTPSEDSGLPRGHSIGAYEWRILSGLIFILFFFLAKVGAEYKFPAAMVSKEVALAILAWSIYVAVLCGLGALMVELIHASYVAGPPTPSSQPQRVPISGGRSPRAFSGYIVLTVLPVIFAPFYVCEQAALLEHAGTSLKQDAARAEVVGNLEVTAPLIVAVYLIADLIALGSNRIGRYKLLVLVDAFVFLVHILAITGIVAWILLPGQPQEIRHFASAVIIGSTLLLQNIAFALITLFRA